MLSTGDLITPIGRAFGRYGDRSFGIRLADRLSHFYVIGQTGTGKSTLLGNMAASDGSAGLGFCLIDPHGDLARHLHDTLPQPHRYWDLADPACQFGYNPLTHVSRPYRPLITSGLIEALHKQWADAWGVRMEHLLRYAVLALLDRPKTDLRDIVPLFLDKDFRRAVVAGIQDEQVRTFWTREFPAMNYKTAIDGVAPIANKVGAFLAHPVLRKALCKPEEPLRFRAIMDQGETLIVNLGKGRLGGDLANVIGGLIVASIMNAALSRHSLPEGERRPFLLYIDEFHSFTTAAIADILPELRKYGLGAILAHQHILQADRAVFEATIGNVGSLMAFRVGALDAPTIAAQLSNVAPADLISQPNYRAFVQLMVDGQKTRAFTATTYPPR